MLKSISKNYLLPIEGYILPSGSSPLHPYYLPRCDSPAQGVFHGVRIANIANEFWSRVTKKAGASVQPTDRASLLNMLTSSRSSGRASLLPDYVIIDPISYVDGIRDPLDEKIISHCLQSENPRLVSTDWVVFCLQLGEIVNPKISAVFGFHGDIQKPLVYKGVKERFEIHDIVYFRTAANDRAVGRIIEFTRRSTESPLMVRILPLQVRDVGRRRELTYSDNCETLVAADSLDGRPVVLPHRAYASAEYANGDVTVLSADEEWTAQELRRVSGCVEEGERDICFSQDY